MVKKSRRGKGRQPPQSKKRKRRQISPVIPSQPQAVVQNYEPTAPSTVAASPIKKPTQVVARYPYITGELRRIGILAGIILTALVVLALVLP